MTLAGWDQPVPTATPRADGILDLDTLASLVRPWYPGRPERVRLPKCLIGEGAGAYARICAPGLRKVPVDRRLLDDLAGTVHATAGL
ncbi:hypothetical protein [Streptomyces triculaminicus]|uniref:hypothetical protein n=1 Tax=Streptomyces triculaminicus TaxID=2816232 RepID=UPI0037D488D0